MKDVFCVGSMPFINLCASGILPKNTIITYVISLDPKNLEFTKKEFEGMDFRKQYLKDIAFFFGYQVIFKERFKLKIKDNDIVTSNLLRFTYPILNGQRLIIFPEGISCLNIFVKKNWSRKIYFNTSYYLKRIIGSYYKASTRWILPDKDGQIRTFLKKNSNNKNKLLSQELLFSNISKCSLYIKKKYPELNFCKDKSIVFHPLIGTLDKSLYKKWFEDFKEIIGKKKLIIKSHDNDNRDYRKVFEKFNYIKVPKKFTTLPAELIVSNYSAVDYLGYYSTIILGFKRRNINLITPPDKNIIKTYNNEYSGLKLIMNI
jgi:hypothetical protein